MNLIPEDKTLVKEIEAPMMQGTLPSWLSTATLGGGTVTALDASNDGGYLNLDPGTTASGDYAKISTFNLTPAAYDVVELFGRIKHTTGNDADATTSLGFEESGSNNALWYFVEGVDNNRIKLESGGSAVFHDVRVVDDTNEHDFRLIWDTTAGTITLITDGFPSGVEISTGIPDATLTYFGQATAMYKGGVAAQAQVSSFGVRYYRKTN